MSLQNTGVTHSNKTYTSSFVDPVLGTIVTFSAKSSTVKPSDKVSVEMVNVTASLNQPEPVGAPECDPCGTAKVNTSATIRFNIQKGDIAQMNAVVGQLQTLVDQAVESYQLAYGVVPPASAVFSGEGA